MSLMSTLNNAVSGLSRNQAGIDTVSRNVANAQTENYIRKEVKAENQATGGVRVTDIERQVSLRAQEQLRREESSAQGMEVIADYTERVDELFGRPGQGRAISDKVAELQKAFTALAGDPDSPVQRQATLNAAEDAAQRINFVSDQLQSMRLEADSQIAEGVETINDALKNVADLNQRIAPNEGRANATAAELKDQRDQQIARISEQLNIKVEESSSGRVNIRTQDGQTLLTDNNARQLSFSATNEVNPQTRFSEDTLGGITIEGPGGETSLMNGGGLSGGKLAGQVAARDEILVGAQDQLDELAEQMTFALSEDGSPVSYETGKDGRITNAEMKLNQQTAGDTLTVAFTQNGEQKSIELTATDKPPEEAGAREFSVKQDRDDLIQQVESKLKDSAGDYGGFSVEASLADGTVTIRDDSAGDNLKLTGFEGYSQGGQLLEGERSQFAGQTGLNLFVDSQGGKQVDYLSRPGNASEPGQKRGFAGRMTVNETVKDDLSKLVRYPKDKIEATQQTIRENQIKSDAAPSPLPENLKGKLGPESVAQKDVVNFGVDEVESGDRFTVKITDLPDTAAESEDSFSVTYTAAGTESPTEVRNALINRDPSKAPGTFNFTGTFPTPANTPVIFDKGSNASELVITATTKGEGFRAEVSAQSGDPGSAGKLAEPGDSTRPQTLARRLGEEKRTFADNAGIASEKTPVKQTVTEFSGTVVAFQGNQASQFRGQADDQRTFADTLQKSFSDRFGVSTDEEMSNLLTLQNSYSANARVLSTVDQLFNQVLNAVR